MLRRVRIFIGLRAGVFSAFVGLGGGTTHQQSAQKIERRSDGWGEANSRQRSCLCKPRGMRKTDSKIFLLTAPSSCIKFPVKLLAYYKKEVFSILNPLQDGLGSFDYVQFQIIPLRGGGSISKRGAARLFSDFQNGFLDESHKI